MQQFAGLSTGTSGTKSMDLGVGGLVGVGSGNNPKMIPNDGGQNRQGYYMTVGGPTQKDSGTAFVSNGQGRLGNEQAFFQKFSQAGPANESGTVSAGSSKSSEFENSAGSSKRSEFENLQGRYRIVRNPDSGVTGGRNFPGSTIQAPFGGNDANRGTFAPADVAFVPFLLDGSTISVDENFRLQSPSLFPSAIEPGPGTFSQEMRFEIKGTVLGGPISGTTTAFRGNNAKTGTEFLLVEAKEANHPGDSLILWAGVPTTEFPVAGATFYKFRRDFILDSSVPFFRRTSVRVDVPDGETSAAIFWDTSGSSDAQRSFLAANGNVKGDQSFQKSAAFVGTGQVLTDGDVTALHASIRGSSRASASELPRMLFGADGRTATAGESRKVNFFGRDAGFFVLEGTKVIDYGTVDSFLNRTDAYLTHTVALPNVEVLESRTSKSMHGYIGGVTENVKDDGVTAGAKRLFWSLSPNEFAHPESNTFTTNKTTNKVKIFLQGQDAVTPNERGPDELFNLHLGDFDVFPGSGDSAFIDDRQFGAIENGFKRNVLTAFGGNSAAQLVLAGLTTVSSGVADGLFPAEVTPCTCSFLNWGVWSANFFISPTLEQERIHLAAWVSGVLAGAAVNQLTMSGATATYSGQLFGTVTVPTGTYLAGGGYTNVWSFSAGTGTVTINKFDGLSFSATQPNAFSVSGPSNQREFHTSGLATSTGSHLATVRGSFVQSPTDNVAGQMGDFRIISASSGSAPAGATYRAAGIIAAQKR
ncbi:MAG: hypothetical protein EXQ91_03420 [Alphaproteobacteria bacterium]|nr:hypothetical protein [Alphaproteobacteria bacterium]